MCSVSSFPALLTSIHTIITIVLISLCTLQVGAENCGEVIAKTHRQNLTDVVLNYRLKNISTNTIEYWKELKRTNADNEQDIYQLLISTAAEILAESQVVQSNDVATTQLTPLDDASKSIIKTDYITTAFQHYVTENFHTNDLLIEEEAHENIKTITEVIKQNEAKADQPIQIRTIFRRFPEGDESAKSEQKALLEKVRAQLISQEIEPQAAVFQYSQAPSASRNGFVEALPRLQYPYIIQKALLGLKENEWSDVIEIKSNVILIQYIGPKKINPPSVQHEIERLTQQKRTEYMKNLLADYVKDKSTELEAQEAFLKAQNIAVDVVISCLIEHDINKHHAEQVFFNRVVNELKMKTELEKKELFNRTKIPFRRMWLLNRFEYRLMRNPSMERESSQFSFAEIEDYWIEKIVPELAQFQTGTHQEAPIPQGWQLEVKPISISYPVKPSVDTPRPVTNPTWNKYTLFSESIATVTPLGNPSYQDEEFLRYEEVGTEQLEILLSIELAGILRKKMIAQVIQETTFEFNSNF